MDGLLRYSASTQRDFDHFAGVWRDFLHAKGLRLPPGYPEVTDRESYLALSRHLKKLLKRGAIDSERVSTILSKLGDGDVQEHQLKILIASYRALPSDAKQYTKTFLSELDQEIEWQEEQRLAELSREELSKLSNSIPDD
jgi:DNA-binding transcriptional ArsR family regulator